jgi:hypothetical protein
MRTFAFALVATLTTLSLIGSADSVQRFSCIPGPVGACLCSGAADCKDMRRSGMCDGPLICKTLDGTLNCTCMSTKSASGVSKHPPTPAGTSGTR